MSISHFLGIHILLPDVQCLKKCFSYILCSVLVCFKQKENWFLLLYHEWKSRHAQYFFKGRTKFLIILNKFTLGESSHHCGQSVKLECKVWSPLNLIPMNKKEISRAADGTVCSSGRDLRLIVTICCTAFSQT